jgi:hypothetical protein
MALCGESVKFELAPGSHEVHLKIVWSRSRTVTEEPGLTATG